MGGVCGRRGFGEGGRGSLSLTEYVISGRALGGEREQSRESRTLWLFFRGGGGGKGVGNGGVGDYAN